jgi:ABC-2 type transport system permease protein
VDMVGSLSFLTHFSGITKGVIGLPTAVFFLSLILLCLFVNTQVIELKKAS